MKSALRIVVVICAIWVRPLLAQADAATEAKQRDILNSLHYQSGEIALAAADAHLRVQPGFRYLGHDDARKVLENLWGNPPDDSVLGLLVPDAASLESDHNWVVVVTYSDDGFVSDDDANKINYTDMLKQMQQDTLAANPDRKKDGYPTMQLVGWAQPPRYDSSGKRLYWAKELAVEGYDGHTLNYDIRVLGRSGYLSLEAVSHMQDLALVNDGMTQVLPMAEFDTGHRYADYKPGSDKLAEYGLAALIGGGIAAKTGLLAKFGLMLLALKKFVIVAFVAIGAFIKKIFGKKGGGGTVQ